MPPFEASPLPTTGPASRPPHGIRFLHPGYPAPTNVILCLPRVDVAGDAGRFGVSHGIALIACQIIACNAFDAGYLAHDRAGRERVEDSLDGVLTEDEYYFVAPDAGAAPYPVVPSFRDWEFPHGRIPDWWPEPSISDASPRCAVTNAIFATEDAHLVPREEVAWYARNGMAKYGSFSGSIQGSIDDRDNLLTLKRDIRYCFDSRWFAIAPKAPPRTSGDADPSSREYVVHLLIGGDAAELWGYRDTLVQYIRQGSRPYLFARFAWTVLMGVKPFVTAGQERKVVRAEVTARGDIEYNIGRVSGFQLRMAYGGGGSRGAAPLNEGKTAAGDTVVDKKQEMWALSDSDIGAVERDGMDDGWDDFGLDRRGYA